MNEALRLAEELEWQTHWKDHAAELRRLLAENEALKAERDEDRRREYGYSQQVVDALTKERDALKAQRDALLEALRYWLPDETMIPAGHEAKWNEAVAAIKAVEGEKS